MSRNFRFDVAVERITRDDYEKLDLTLPIGEIWEYFEGTGEVSFEDTLTSGLSDAEFASDFAKDIFAALGRTVPVQIASTYLGRGPDEIFTFGQGEETA